MKTFLLAILALVVAVPSFAAYDFHSAVPFANISAASAAVKTSSAYYVAGYKQKTIHVSGVTLTSTVAAPVFKSMSGTILAQCAPTSSGPWSTCTQGQSTAGATVSLTANGMLTWEGASQYVRLYWTSGTIGQKLKAWLNWQ